MMWYPEYNNSYLQIRRDIKMVFLLLFPEIIIVGANVNRLNMAILMSTNNV